jgi:hypothetical protein
VLSLSPGDANVGGQRRSPATRKPKRQCSAHLSVRVRLGLQYCQLLRLGRGNLRQGGAIAAVSPVRRLGCASTAVSSLSLSPLCRSRGALTPAPAAVPPRPLGTTPHTASAVKPWEWQHGEPPSTHIPTDAPPPCGCSEQCAHLRRDANPDRGFQQQVAPRVDHKSWQCLRPPPAVGRSARPHRAASATPLTQGQPVAPCNSTLLWRDPGWVSAAGVAWRTQYSSKSLRTAMASGTRAHGKMKWSGSLAQAPSPRWRCWRKRWQLHPPYTPHTCRYLCRSRWCVLIVLHVQPRLRHTAATAYAHGTASASALGRRNLTRCAGRGRGRTEVTAAGAAGGAPGGAAVQPAGVLHGHGALRAVRARGLHRRSAVRLLRR